MIAEIKQGGCISLRNAEPGDLPAVVSLLEQARLPTAGVAEALPHFLVAESGDRVVGVAGLELYDRSALLRSVAVDPSWRGTGVGRVLVERALETTKAHGIPDVFLLTTTAEHYFPRFGFVCVNRDAVAEDVKASPEFQGACPASAIVMRKTLATK